MTLCSLKVPVNRPLVTAEPKGAYGTTDEGADVCLPSVTSTPHVSVQGAAGARAIFVFAFFFLHLSCLPFPFIGGTLARPARARRVPGIFCDPCPTGGLLLLICWATLYGFAPEPPGHQQMF